MKNSLLARLTSAQLRRAATFRDRIEKLERQLAKIIGVPEEMTVGTVVRKKRKMSAAWRKKIAAAARARWARVRAAKQ